ncbi:probable insulin-like peptide 2 [Drosophila takahashii]|uniref:probable insulin-like peptide 2 n=1 Tax=Drosophila takahashii TaxID=29030 RepID=UPI0007E60D05|nr:probable insulin-like peptide 2 [Drosophila takahashii]
MCKPLSFILLSAVIILASSPAQANAMRSCGEKLIEMMNYACETFNPVIGQQKRAMQSNDLDLLDPLQYVQNFEEDNSISEPEPSRLFRGNSFERVLSSLAEIQRRTRQQGIVNRCCKSPCSFAVIQEYCSVPKSH